MPGAWSPREANNDRSTRGEHPWDLEEVCMSRAFGPNISVSAWNLRRQSDREQYEMEVATILAVDLLNGSQVGRVVIEAIWAVHGRHMRIQPWTAADENAEALPLEWRDATTCGERLR